MIPRGHHFLQSYIIEKHHQTADAPFQPGWDPHGPAHGPGHPFLSRLMVDLCQLLQVRHLKTLVYHSQTNGLVERFSQILKHVLKKVVD